MKLKRKKMAKASNSSKSQVASSKTDPNDTTTENNSKLQVASSSSKSQVASSKTEPNDPAADKEVKTGGVKPVIVLNDPKFKDFIAGYLKAYPKEKLFLVTTDWQVFLAANRDDATTHQKVVDKDKAVCEYRVN